MGETIKKLFRRYFGGGVGGVGGVGGAGTVAGLRQSGTQANSELTYLGPQPANTSKLVMKRRIKLYPIWLR